MLIAVIDAQGAGIGRSAISELRREFGQNIKIYALGTNENACQNMKTAGADGAVCGNKKIKKYLETRAVDCIIGPMGILSSGGIQGEISCEISSTVFNAKCKKYIIPLNLHGVFIPGTSSMKIKDSILEIVNDIKNSFLL